ncbi:hypothetical protein H0H92_004967 [Tricholoma furcatifolium]|nr:hypothetical protein H0H92_004967 [Tricholoma furcatifolium]
MLFVTQPSSTSGNQASVQTFEPEPSSAPTPSSSCGRTSRMTRGRKKDLTIPPTRALVQQRDYRARRAKYVSDLEERVRKVEEENDKLRQELATVRAGQPVPLSTMDAQTAHASAELMHNLSVASASLARFHQLAFSGQSSSSQDSRLAGGSSKHVPLLQHPTNPINVSRPTSFPSPAPSPPYAFFLSERPTHPPRRKRLYREDSPESVISQSEDNDYSQSRASSPCCGGILDCRELIERVDSGATDEHELPRPYTQRRSHSPDLSHPMRYNARRY